MRDPNINNKNSSTFEFNLFVVFRIAKEILLSIKDANDIRIIFFKKSKFGKCISSFRKLRASKIQTIKLTIPEDKMIPTIPKLYGERLSKFFIGAPIKNQSKKALRMIPANDN